HHMAKQPLKIGFIGVGGIAGAHLGTLKSFREKNAEVPDFEIVCGADLNEEAKEKAKAEYGVGETYSDYEEMLEKHPDLDAVSICTPNTCTKAQPSRVWRKACTSPSKSRWPAPCRSART
ncbi:MAG: Gfo/Idh/MocA family oxidoreductase, partial [Planctomycetota bacterium]